MQLGADRHEDGLYPHVCRPTAKSLDLGKSPTFQLLDVVPYKIRKVLVALLPVGSLLILGQGTTSGLGYLPAQVNI